jgi:hypothetical protein
MLVELNIIRRNGGVRMRLRLRTVSIVTALLAGTMTVAVLPSAARSAAPKAYGEGSSPT